MQKMGTNYQKNYRDFYFFGNSGKTSVISIKCQLIDNILRCSFFANNSTFIYLTIYEENKWGSLAVMGGSFLRAPHFEGARAEFQIVSLGSSLKVSNLLT